MNKNALQPIRPLLLIFIFITAFCLTGKKWLAGQGIDHEVLLVGNLVLFAVSMGAYWVNYRSLRSTNPQSSVRAMYGSFMIKFFVVAIAAFIYIMMEKKNVNKGGLLVCAGLYVIYTVFETRALMGLARIKKDA
ncbi:MAG TPA: hypothetical protein VMZ03_08930 [Chitinophagaceae bacterium]|nr:hypothetical protein [Chitinophagaceae bacterium]